MNLLLDTVEDNINIVLSLVLSFPPAVSELHGGIICETEVGFLPPSFDDRNFKFVLEGTSVPNRIVEDSQDKCNKQVGYLLDSLRLLVVDCQEDNQVACY